MKKTGAAWMVFRLALVCVELLLIGGLAYPTAAGAQARGKDDVPEQLWQIYPLDPTKTDAAAPQTAQPQPPTPGPQTQTDSAVQTTSQSQKAQAQPSGESDPGRSLAFPLLGALLVLLVGLLVVAAARKGALAIAGEYRARGGSALESPVRAATSAPRYVGRGSATVVSPLRTLRRLARRIGYLLLWPVRGSAAILTYVVRSVAFAGEAARQAAAIVLHACIASRSDLLFYAFTVLVSVGLGVIVAHFLQS
jgi:hypothetical protein